MKFQVETVVRGGFPIVVVGTVQPPDYEVGITNSYIDDYSILTKRGKPTGWLKLREEEVNSILENVWGFLERQEREARYGY